MFSMTIVFGASPVPWTLLFKTQETLAAAMTAYKNPQVFGDMNNLSVTDDFGQEVSIKLASISGVMFEDLNQSKLAQIERALHQTRTQIEADNMGRADPTIMAASRTRAQPPGVITPFGPNGAFPRQ